MIPVKEVQFIVTLGMQTSDRKVLDSNFESKIKEMLENKFGKDIRISVVNEEARAIKDIETEDQTGKEYHKKTYERQKNDLNQYTDKVNRMVAQMDDSALPNHLRYERKGIKDYHKSLIAIKKIEKMEM
ncbi:MAG: hypothetical protein ABIG64_09005 [Candidatus Omnitrophota bacterium]